MRQIFRIFKIFPGRCPEPRLGGPKTPSWSKGRFAQHAPYFPKIFHKPLLASDQVRPLTCDPRQNIRKPLHTDWRGASTCRFTEKRSSHFQGAKLLAPALAPKVLLVRSSFGWAGEPVLSLSGVCLVSFVFEACTSWGPCLSTMSHSSIVHLVRHAKRSRCFDQRSVKISDRSVARYLKSEHRKFWKKLDSASRLESFISFSSKMLAKWPSIHVH